MTTGIWRGIRSAIVGYKQAAVGIVIDDVGISFICEASQVRGAYQLPINQLSLT